MARKKFLATIAFALHLSPPLNCATPTITLEHAWTSDQISWGLMQRKAIPENHGMLFHYNSPFYPSFWSFNCYIDLSVAFIDSNKIITEIASLYAHPEKMDPLRPVARVQDIGKYPPNDPIMLFFKQHTVNSKKPVQYVLEMNLGWFEENGITAGDKIHWDTTTHTAYFNK